MLQIWHIMPSSQLFEINLDDKIIYFVIHYRNREYNNLDSVTAPLFAFLHQFWQIVLSGTIVKRVGLSTTPLRTLFKHFKKSQMLWVLIPVPPLLPGAQWHPRPSPGSPRGLLLLPLVKAHSSSDRGARPDQDGDEGGEDPQWDQDRQLFTQSQWELVTGCLLLIRLALVDWVVDVVRHNNHSAVGLIVGFEELVVL